MTVTVVLPPLGPELGLRHARLVCQVRLHARAQLLPLPPDRVAVERVVGQAAEVKPRGVRAARVVARSRVQRLAQPEDDVPRTVRRILNRRERALMPLGDGPLLGG